MPTSEIVGIRGTGTYFPKKIVSMETLAKKHKLDYRRVMDDHGVSALHVADKDETELYMAQQAAKAAMMNGGMSPEDIHLIIYCKGMTKQKSVRSSALSIIKHMDAKNAYGFDIEAGFVGGLIGMHVAADIIHSSFYMNSAIVVASQLADELYMLKGSKHQDMILGDGAAAVVLSKESQNNKILTSNFMVDHYSNFIDNMISPEFKKSGKLKILIDALGGSGDVMKTLTERWVYNTYKMLEYCMGSINLDIEDINHIIKTQLSLKETSFLATRLGIDPLRIHNASSEKGNLGHADILCNLHLALQNESLRNLDILAAVATNYDCSTGAVIIRR